MQFLVDEIHAFYEQNPDGWQAPKGNILKMVKKLIY